MVETFWQQAKKQGFSVILLIVAVVSMFTYFTKQLDRLEFKLNKVEANYEECIKERVNDLKNFKSGNLVGFNSTIDSLEFVIPSKKEGVFS